MATKYHISDTFIADATDVVDQVIISLIIHSIINSLKPSDAYMCQ